MEILLNLFDKISFENKEKIEVRDMFFIMEPSWSSMDLKNEYKEFPTLLFFLINHPDCEKELQDKLEKFKNNDKQIPLFIIFLRIFSSQSNLKIKYKKESPIYKIISEELETQILTYLKEKKNIKNMDWIGLLTDIESKFINPKIKKIYNYFKNLCSFELNNCSNELILKNMIQNFISLILPKIFSGEVDKIFEEDIFNEKSVSQYLTDFNKKLCLEIEKTEKEKTQLYSNNLKESFQKILKLWERPNMKKLNYNFVDSINEDIRNEKEENTKKLFNSKIEQLKNKINSLKKNQKEYINCYNILTKGINDIGEFHKHIKYLIEIRKKLTEFLNPFSKKKKKKKEGLDYYSIEILQKELSSELIILPINFTIKLERESYIYIPINKIEQSNIKINIKDNSRPIKVHIEKKIIEKLDEDIVEEFIENTSKELNKCNSDGEKCIRNLNYKKIKIDDVEFEIDKTNNDYIQTLNNIFNQLYKILKEYTSSEEKQKVIIIENNIKKLTQIRRDLEKMEFTSPIFIDGIGKPKKTEEVLIYLKQFKTDLLNIFNKIKKTMRIKEDVNKIIQQIMSNFDDSIVLYDLRNIDDLSFEIEIDESKLENNNNNLYPYISKEDNKLYFNLFEYNWEMEPIIPSLYENEKYIFNIVSFVDSSLKVKIEMGSDIQEQFSVSNILEPLTPISIFFKVPGMDIEKPIEKEYKGILIVTSIDNVKSQASIYLNFKFQYYPLIVLFNGLDNEYEMKANKLLLLKDKIYVGSVIFFQIEIEGFHPNKDFYNGRIERISLEDNNVEKPVIKTDKNDFSIIIPSIDNNGSKLHGLFNIYITEKLIIPIEINAEIKNKKLYLASYDYINGVCIKNKYDLYLYRKFKGYTLHIIVGLKDNLEHELEVKVPNNKNIQFILINCENKIKFNSFYIVDIKIVLGNLINEPNNEKFSLIFIVDGIQHPLKCNMYYDTSESFIDKDFSKIPFFYYNKNENDLKQVKDKICIKEEKVLYTPFFPYIINKNRINKIIFNKRDLQNIIGDKLICINKIKNQYDIIPYEDIKNKEKDYIKILTLRDGIPGKFWIPNTYITEEGSFEFLTPTKENIKKAEKDISNLFSLWDELNYYYQTNNFYEFIKYIQKVNYGKMIEIIKNLNNKIFQNQKLEECLIIPNKCLEIIYLRNILFIIKFIMEKRNDEINEYNYFCIDYSILNKIREEKFKNYNEKKFIDNFYILFEKKRKKKIINGYLLKIKNLQKKKKKHFIKQKLTMRN